MGKERKYLSKSKWYHGTTLDGFKKICSMGVRADYNKGNELDFGYGFYLTPVKEQAESFIKKLLQYDKTEIDKTVTNSFGFPTKENEDKKIAVVIEFEFTPLQWFEGDYYKHKILNAYDDEFAEFVFNNRINYMAECNQHNYDLIFGVMSDSLPIILMQRYKNGELSKEQVIEGLKKQTSAKQLSIHNQKICDIINISNAYYVESGKELDINDYNNK